MLVWIHDLEKNPDRENEYAPGPPRTRAELEGLGISDATPTWSVHTLERYDATTDLAEAPIKVQIVSSADLASHPVGPFLSLYWYETHTSPSRRSKPRIDRSCRLIGNRR